jgi:hypothetical protein
MRNERRDIYGFTEKEDLWDRVSDQRFHELIDEPQTTIHQITIDSNNYGEFLFVATSRPVGDRRVCITFYGQGFHEHRERWYTNEWSWYEAHGFPETLEKSIPKDEARELIEERRREIAPYAIDQPQSGRARLFEMLADLTDEDGAYAELEDMNDLADWLGGDVD